MNRTRDVANHLVRLLEERHVSEFSFDRQRDIESVDPEDEVTMPRWEAVGDAPCQFIIRTDGRVFYVRCWRANEW